MKARRTLHHNELVSQLIEHLKLRFTPDMVQIKKRIESLIERGYLKRDDDDKNIYFYLAESE